VHNEEHEAQIDSLMEADALPPPELPAAFSSFWVLDEPAAAATGAPLLAEISQEEIDSARRAERIAREAFDDHDHAIGSPSRGRKRRRRRRGGAAVANELAQAESGEPAVALVEEEYPADGFVAEPWEVDADEGDESSAADQPSVATAAPAVKKGRPRKPRRRRPAGAPASSSAAAAPVEVAVASAPAEAPAKKPRPRRPRKKKPAGTEEPAVPPASSPISDS
jgi:hypothetical protein